MSAKIITVWGSPGSGKSLLATALAAILAEKNANVIVFNGDTLVPSLKMFCPSKVIDSKKSIGPLLMSGRYDDAAFAERLISHPECEYIAYAGMAPTDTYITYSEFERPYVIQMANKMAQLADYVIIDGLSNPLKDMMTLIGLEISDIIIRVITADTKGILYQDAARSIYREAKYKMDEHITILGNVHDVSPVSEVMSVSGKYDFILKYSPEVENHFIAGQLIKDLKTSQGRSFEKNVRKLARRITE